MECFLVNTYWNKGWGSRFDNHDKLWSQRLFKNRYRAIQHIKSYGYLLNKGRRWETSEGFPCTIYNSTEEPRYTWHLIRMEVE